MHSPEPWSIPIDEEGWLCIYAGNSKAVYAVPPDKKQWRMETLLAFEDAERIVACVNFCRYLPSDMLAKFTAVPKLGFAVIDGTRKRWDMEIKENGSTDV